MSIEISTNPYEGIIQPNKPTFIKPQLYTQKIMHGISNIEEIILENFHKSIPENNTAKFTMVCHEEYKTINIDAITYRILSTAFKTIGRFPEEMEAIFILQKYLITNINNIRNKKGLISTLKKIPENANAVLIEIKRILITLCEQDIT